MYFLVFHGSDSIGLGEQITLYLQYIFLYPAPNASYIKDIVEYLQSEEI